MDKSELRPWELRHSTKPLGPAEALRFLALFHSEPTDYVEISKKLYEIRVWRKSSTGPKNIEEAEV